jgi:hypothetical protein
MSPRLTLATDGCGSRSHPRALVPKRFFRDEAEALARGRKLWNDLMDHFAISQRPGPRPPLPVEFNQELQRVLGDSRATATLGERRVRPSLAFLTHEALREISSDPSAHQPL